MMRTYKVTAIKSGKYWHLDIEGFIQGTQAKSLAEADAMAKDFIENMTDERPEEISVDLTIQQTDDIAEARDRAPIK